MRTRMSALLAFLLLACLGVSVAQAGARIDINDEAYIDLGFRVQAMIMNYDKYYNWEDSNGDPQAIVDTVEKARLRRARIRLKGVINKHVTAFLQTEAISFAGAGLASRIIDGWVDFKLNNWLQLYTGLHMAPILRQNLTSSGALMALDRPGLNNKALTWGSGSSYAFANDGLISAGVVPDAPVRDIGATIFGTGQLGETTSIKYYAGMYNGVPNELESGALETDKRFTVRAQFNIGDPEPGYFQSSTYLGGKSTIAIGVGYDTQSNVLARGGKADYSLMTVDFFLDKPLGSNALTFEGAWMLADWGDEASLKQLQGSGFYGQLGFLINQKWQPWILYETFASDSDDTASFQVDGNYDTYRIGLSWFLDGQHANIKAGYEMVNMKQKLEGTDKDNLSSFVLGFFTTY